MRKPIRNSIVSLAVLAGIALTPSAALASTPTYCVPPSGVAQTAQQAANATAAALGGYTTPTLSALSSFSTSTATSGFGLLGVTVVTREVYPAVVVGSGVGWAFLQTCTPLTVLLTPAGKHYLASIKAGQRATLTVYTVFFGAGIGIYQRGATVAY